MPTMLEYFEYAKLATAAYVDLKDVPQVNSLYVGAQLAAAADRDERVPIALARRMFDPNQGGAEVWTVRADGYIGNDAVGFAATLFERGGEKVLAIRGTEPNAQGGLDLKQADLAGIGLLGMSLPQAVSMVNYVLRLRASADDSAVAQLHIQTSTERLSVHSVQATGTRIIDDEGQRESFPIYIDFTVTQDGEGLGLIAARSLSTDLRH